MAKDFREIAWGRLWLLLGVGAALVVLSLVAFSAQRAAQLFMARQQQVRVLPPAQPPEPSQESIALALAIYGIKVPGNALFPVYDSKLEDRGLTILRGLDSPLEIKIGPSAFSSWGLLGSTLAHEIEVHCAQNFALIRMQDLSGFDGTGNAERQAYAHELHNAERFGLSLSDQTHIVETMNFYYPQTSRISSLFTRLELAATALEVKVVHNLFGDTSH